MSGKSVTYAQYTVLMGQWKDAGLVAKGKVVLALGIQPRHNTRSKMAHKCDV